MRRKWGYFVKRCSDFTLILYIYSIVPVQYDIDVCIVKVVWRSWECTSIPYFEWRCQLTLMLLLANLTNKNDAKNLKNDWNTGTWVLIWEYSVRTIQWIPTWQGSDCFQKSLHPCALGNSCLSIVRVNPYPANHNNCRGVQQCL